MFSKPQPAQVFDETLTNEEEEIYLMSIDMLGDNLAYACLRGTPKLYPTKPQIVALQLSREPSVASKPESRFRRSRAPSLAQTGSTVSGTSLVSFRKRAAKAIEQRRLGELDAGSQSGSELGTPTESLRSSILQDALKHPAERLVVRERPRVNLVARMDRPASMAYTLNAYWRMSGADQSHTATLNATRLWQKSKQASLERTARHPGYEESSWGIITPEDSVSNVNSTHGTRHDALPDLFDFEMPDFDPKMDRRPIAI